MSDNEYSKELYNALQDLISKGKTVTRDPSLRDSKKAAKIIKDENQRYLNLLEEDVLSKLSLRSIVLTILIGFLVVQIFFMNIIVGKVVDNALIIDTEKHLSYIPNETLSLLSSLLKWYTGAVVVELITTFTFIVKEIFKAPQIKN